MAREEAVHRKGCGIRPPPERPHALEGRVVVKTVTYTSIAALAVASAVASTPASAQSRDTIQIAGSSTVLPFASIVAEEFGAVFPDFNTPVVGSGGSGGGLRQFCEGVGEGTIDIANASRPIKQGEIEACNA